MAIALILNAENTSEIRDIIHFDATLSYSASFQSKLTSNPIDGGAKTVNDHIVIENAVYTVKGIISGADFNLGRPPPSKFKTVNGGAAFNAVEVTKTTESLLESVAGKFLPFGKTVEPQVSMDDRSDSLSISKEALLNIRNQGRVTSIIEFNPDGSVGDEIKNLVITSLQFNEDAGSGDVLSVDITLQQATFVELKTRTVQTVSAAKTSGKIATQAQDTVDKGIQTKKKTIFHEGVTKLSETTVKTLDSLKNKLKDGYTKDVVTLLQGGME